MKKLFNIAVALLVIWSLLLFTSCSKEENPPQPQVTEEPAASHFTDQFVKDGLVGTWLQYNIHHSGSNGYYDETTNDTVIYTSTVCTWLTTSNSSTYVMNGKLIDYATSVDLTVIEMSENGQHMTLHTNISMLSGFTEADIQFQRIN